MEPDSKNDQENINQNEVEKESIERDSSREAVGSVAKGVAKKGVKKGAKKAAEKVAKKAATKTATKAAAQAAGTTVPGIGNVAAFIATEVIPKIFGAIKKFASGALQTITGEKDRRKQIAALAGISVLLFLSVGATIPAIFAGVTFLGAGASLLGGGALAGGARGVIRAFTIGLTSVIPRSFFIPILIIIFGSTIAITVIVFIINSGAYIVPPENFSIVEDNPYIGVTKEVDPSGPFDNSDLPITVTYTITVEARRGSLTNIVFNHECEVITENNNFSCPAPLPSTTPSIISPVDPYVYTYTQTYSGSNYNDSLVLNTFTVTADTDEVLGTSSSGAVSIIIGDPPTGCFTLEGSWPEPYRSNILSAIATLTSNYTPFAARVCTGGTVNLRYTTSPICGTWACAHNANNISFNAGGLSNSADSLYILTHESGHIVASRIPSLYQAYVDYPGVAGERPLCSYSETVRAPEGFAEAAALYVQNRSCVAPSFADRYPAHYNFVDTYLFR